MKIRFYSIIALVMMAVFSVYGGNPDRQGQAGASELLMNPWGHSAGLHSYEYFLHYGRRGNAN
ncbi:MAG: hypothetical protein LC127_14680 [Chitinophagales bacterium]|nr:hypothetical protein [Chitinophagales bacterium]